jgi:hypothetical protein
LSFSERKRQLTPISPPISPLENSFVVPEAALVDVPAALRAPADPAPRAAEQGGEQAEPRERS